MKNAPITVAAKVTIYHKAGGNLGSHVVKHEARSVAIAVEPYAQFDAGVIVDFVPKGAQRSRRFTETTDASTVVLDGWGHPEPASLFDPATEKTSGGVTTSSSRYSSCDPRWTSEFRTMIEAYAAKSGAKVLADFHGHDPKERR